MENFNYYSPTKIIFGKGTENQVGAEVSKYGKKVLLHYGGGSIKAKTLYDNVVASLNDSNIDFIELAGVKPNPRLSLVYEGIELCRQEKVDFILAVGGGSVIDSAKAIALGIQYEGDVWDYFIGKKITPAPIPLGVILTISAAGSETGCGTVITNEKGWYKRPYGDDLLRPKFTILNPELTFSVSHYQTACGAADIMAHVFERYFTNTLHVGLTDRLCEGALKTIIENAPLLLIEPNNYDARAEVMWASTLAHNDLLGTGRIADWASHNIEHELSGIYDVTHGAGLSVILPAWMRYVCRQNPYKIVQFATEIFGEEYNIDAPESAALEGIEKLIRFFKSLGLPTTLGELNIPADRFREMAQKCTETGPVGNYVLLNEDDVYNILIEAL